MSEDLPKGWVRLPLREVAEVRLGRQRSPDRATGDHMRPYMRAANVTWQGISLEDVKEMDFSPKEFETYRLHDGDILLSEASGSATEVGKPAIWRDQVQDCCFQNTLIRVRSRGPLPEYLHLHFLADARLGRFAVAGKGVGINHLGADRMASWPTALPPLNEQRRIVAKLEALQARSRRAREALDAVPSLLEKLRQSILAAAFRGDLTKDWRAKNKEARSVDISPEAAFTELKAKKRLWGSGRTADAVNEAWGALPDSWQWVRVSGLNAAPGVAVQIGPMSMKSNEFTDEGNIVLNVGCVQRGHIDTAKADHLPLQRARDFERYRLRAGDVMFTRSGTVGRCACLPEALDGALMTFHLLRVRPSPERCSSTYLMYAFQGCRAVTAQIDASSVGATRAGFNTRLLEEMWIPLPPREEQDELVTRVSELFARVDGLASYCDDMGAGLRTFERATLTRAFRGELVPQDPSDEPAEALLLRGSGAARGATTNGERAKRTSASARARVDEVQ